MTIKTETESPSDPCVDEANGWGYKAFICQSQAWGAEDGSFWESPTTHRGLGVYRISLDVRCSPGEGKGDHGGSTPRIWLAFVRLFSSNRLNRNRNQTPSLVFDPYSLFSPFGFPFLNVCVFVQYQLIINQSLQSNCDSEPLSNSVDEWQYVQVKATDDKSISPSTTSLVGFNSRCEGKCDMRQWILQAEITLSCLIFFFYLSSMH